jgi:hypothetical protein
MAATLHAARRSMPSSLLSLTYPNKELFHRQHALLRGAVSAGLPAPADDEVQQRISLDEHLVEHVLHACGGRLHARHGHIRRRSIGRR